MGQIDEAAALFKLAIANQVYNFVEYRFAVLELMKLKPAQTEDEKKKKCGHKTAVFKTCLFLFSFVTNKPESEIELSLLTFEYFNDRQNHFNDLGFLPEFILKAVSDLGFETPSPIQQACIPALLEGRDVLGM